mmetsp:Transcript_22281/g.42516  ORF Transcript_22281/g.42516 Transcript_22281/m.42516 type:complete len:200 (+) Transcript_22281:2224-2823(+)
MHSDSAVFAPRGAHALRAHAAPGVGAKLERVEVVEAEPVGVHTPKHQQLRGALAIHTNARRVARARLGHLPYRLHQIPQTGGRVEPALLHFKAIQGVGPPIVVLPSKQIEHSLMLGQSVRPASRRHSATVCCFRVRTQSSPLCIWVSTRPAEDLIVRVGTVPLKVAASEHKRTWKGIVRGQCRSSPTPGWCSCVFRKAV